MLIEINWNPSRKEMRNFGLVIWVGFAIIGVVLDLTGRWSAAAIIWKTAFWVGLLILLLPSLAKPLYWIWMGFAYLMGTVVSTFVLCLIFFGIFTPVGLCMRLFGRDPLKLRKSSFGKTSYYSTFTKMGNKDSYHRLF